MNVQTITVDPDVAIAKLDEFRTVLKNNRKAMFTEEDQLLRQLYRAVKKGARVLDVGAAFKTAGLSEKKHPRLAMAKAEWGRVRFSPGVGRGGGTFGSPAHERERFILPDDTFVRNMLPYGDLHVAVPYIPINLRPKIALSNFHVLFEVEEWNVYPVDPFLLRRIDGNLFIVVAEWELTELEQMLLGSMAAN